MKPIVSALNAQFGVDAVGKRCFNACILRAPCNGMEDATLFMWRPDLVGRRTPFAVNFRSVYGSALNLLCGANYFLAKASAVYRVACLEWTVRIEDQARLVAAGRVMSLLLEILSAKEAKKR